MDTDVVADEVEVDEAIAVAAVATERKVNSRVLNSTPKAHPREVTSNNIKDSKGRANSNTPRHFRAKDTATNSMANNNRAVEAANARICRTPTPTKRTRMSFRIRREP